MSVFKIKTLLVVTATTSATVCLSQFSRSFSSPRAFRGDSFQFLRQRFRTRAGGQLHVINEFGWHGNLDKDPSVVHIDVLHAKILGINMSVGVEGCIGKQMIRESRGLDVYVCRSLRDVFRKVPTLSLEIKFYKRTEQEVRRICCEEFFTFYLALMMSEA